MQSNPLFKLSCAFRIETIELPIVKVKPPEILINAEVLAAVLSQPVVRAKSEDET